MTYGKENLSIFLLLRECISWHSKSIKHWPHHQMNFVEKMSVKPMRLYNLLGKTVQMTHTNKTRSKHIKASDSIDRSQITKLNWDKNTQKHIQLSGEGGGGSFEHHDVFKTLKYCFCSFQSICFRISKNFTFCQKKYIGCNGMVFLYSRMTF